MHVGQPSTVAEYNVHIDRVAIALKEARQQRNRQLVLMYEDELAELEAERNALLG